MNMYLTRSISVRLAAFSVFYMAQGVPIGLITIALPAWLVAQGSEAADIATLAAVTGLPWGFKLISGPFMDRFSFPAMGRRRPWVMAAQAGLTLAILSMATVSDPANQLWSIIAIGFVINTFAALQDVAVDGMAIDLLPEEERGRANAFMAFGQVAGFSIFGALTGYLLIEFGLPLTALVCGISVGAVFVFITLLREREGERLLPWTPGEATPRSHEVSASFVQIFRDLFRVLFLPMSLILVGVEFMHRLSAGISVSIFPVMAVNELGYSSDEYAYWIGLLGAGSAVVGLAFGPFIDRVGAKPVLALGFGIAIATPLLFAWAEPYWESTPLVLTALVSSQIASQLIFVAVIASFMGLCWARVAATQFAVYMSLSNLSRSAGAGMFALVAADTSSVQALYMIAGLHMVGLALLMLFNPSTHLARLNRFVDD